MVKVAKTQTETNNKTNDCDVFDFIRTNDKCVITCVYNNNNYNYKHFQFHRQM